MGGLQSPTPIKSRFAAHPATPRGQHIVTPNLRWQSLPPLSLRLSLPVSDDHHDDRNSLSKSTQATAQAITIVLLTSSMIA